MAFEPRRPAWLASLLVMVLVTAAWLGALLLLDLLLDLGERSGLWGAALGAVAGSIERGLGNLPEVIVAVLGIAITVVSIVLQLSATRYTPRVTGMFFADRTNLVVLGFFVVTSVHCIAVTFIVHPGFEPRALVLSTPLVMVVAVLALIPYFKYVFHFLDPERVVTRLQERAAEDALSWRGERDDPAAGAPPPELLRAREAWQRHVVDEVEQLADVAVNAISQKDRTIASRAVNALRALAIAYARGKGRLDGGWFLAGGALRDNPDFHAMSPTSLAQLSERRVWLEWKILRQYQSIFNESLNRMRDVSQLVALETAKIGADAIDRDDRPLLRLAIKFFNTYLRATINQRDVRTAYNVLHQYRQLAEAVLAAGWHDEVVQVAEHLRYYGQTANAAGLSFVTETAAYDLCALCRVAHEAGFPREEDVLAIFLEVDKAPETEAEERSLRGVRKAQIKLATYYLDVGADPLARRIWRDMEQEDRARLEGIREELLAVRDKEFWEVVDRGENFDYLPPRLREKLSVFYGWFDTPHAAAGGQDG